MTVQEHTTRPAGGPNLVEVAGASMRFGRFTAVDAVGLTVRAGEVVGLLGANGAGKTTLVRMLLGLLRPTAGTVSLFGAAPARAGRRRLGYVPQGLGLYEDLTVSENLRFSAAAFGVSAPPAATLGPGLREAANTLVGDLSLGLRRRTAFAAALAHDPDLLVLDEPTSGVEPLARARLWDTIHAAAESGAGALVTTHHMDEAEQCDRLVIMAAGRVVAEGTVSQVVGDLTALEVHADRWDTAFTALDEAALPVTLTGRSVRLPVTARDRATGILQVHGVNARLEEVPATLEEAFVRLAAPEPAASTAGR